RRAGVKYPCGCAFAPQCCALQSASACHELRSFPRRRESTTSCPGRAKRDPGHRKTDLRPWVPATGSPRRERARVAIEGTSRRENLDTSASKRGTSALLPWTVGTRFATGRSPCGVTAAALRAHSSVGRAADS